MDPIPRFAARLVDDALLDTPVVVVQGPRQAGKTTLVESYLGTGRLHTYVTLDDLDVRSAAVDDPQGFVAGLGEGAIIDEIQRVPELVLAIKASVDRDRHPGRFLLTGSANPFHRQEETLAGRREDIHLWPLAQAELEGRTNSTIDSLFDNGVDDVLRELPPCSPDELLQRVLHGGFPTALTRSRGDRVQAWFRGYTTEVVRGEVAELSAIDGLLDLPRLLRLVATRNAGLLNTARLARDAGLAPQTARRYLTLLVETFLLGLIPAWTTSARKRLVKSPKAIVVDSGLAAHLGDLTPDRLSRMPELRGPLFEGFVLSELRRLADWSTTRPTLWHFRTERGHEVDAVLEDRGGRVIGIEVKAGSTVTGDDFRGLRALADATGDAFREGIVVHPGRRTIPFGDRLWAVPMSLLWAE